MNRPAALLALALCALPSAAGAAVFKIATLSPEGSSWMRTMREGADEVERRTGGRVQIKFYPGGVMGDDAAVLRKMRVKQLQGGAVTLGAVARFYPDSQVYGLPMLFRSLEEVTHLRSKLDPVILDGLERGGLVGFGLAEGGFAYIMSQRPQRSVEDLRGSKPWVPSADELTLEAVRAYDVRPIPLPLGDVLTGLQTGLVDTVAAPPIATIALHWHTQVRYLTDMPLLYSTALMVVDKGSFDRLEEADRRVMREVMGRVFGQIDQRNRADNRGAFDAIVNQGIEIVRPDPSQLQEWRRLSAEAVRKLVASGRIGEEIVREAERHLDEFRGRRR